jgi:hypothetical protein
MGEIKRNRLLQQALAGKRGLVRMQAALASDHPFNIATHSRPGRTPIDSARAVTSTGNPDMAQPGVYDADRIAPHGFHFPYGVRMATMRHPIRHRAPALEASRYFVFTRSTNADSSARRAGASLQTSRHKRPDSGCQISSFT